jgi:nucleotide-binding universal stress UspA family protein
MEPTAQDLVNRIFRRIVVATDFNESAKKALDLATSLAVSMEAELTVVHVLEIPAYAYGTMSFAAEDLITPFETAAEQMLASTMTEVRAKCPRAKGVVVKGVPWLKLLETAKGREADLVVLGTHGRRGLTRAVLGSVAEKVVRVSPIPVLTVHGA